MFESIKNKMAEIKWKNHIKAVGPDQALFEAKTKEQVCMALNAGADINAKDDLRARPLTLAALNGETEKVKLLIEKGADVNAKDGFDKTPLFYAVQYNYIEIVKLLIAAGTDLSVQQYGTRQTVLDYANTDEMKKLLRKHGAPSWFQFKAESYKQRTDPKFRAKLAATKEHLKSKPRLRGVSGVVTLGKAKSEQR